CRCFNVSLVGTDATLANVPQVTSLKKLYVALRMSSLCGVLAVRADGVQSASHGSANILSFQFFDPKLLLYNNFICKTS
ncbi:hypothetical protein ACP3W1_24460, partial [Salmonella enterica]|uniref:hypothetical protein n=1 Tax=Salmonella enterica TaxID=28901 RepID=UPI003CF18DDC